MDDGNYSPSSLLLVPVVSRIIHAMRVIELCGLVGTGMALGLALGFLLGGHSGGDGWLNFFGAFGGAGVTVIGAHLLEQRKRTLEASAHAKIVLGKLPAVEASMAECANLIIVLDKGQSASGDVDAVSQRACDARDAIDSLSQIHAVALPSIVESCHIVRDTLDWMVRQLDPRIRNAASALRRVRGHSVRDINKSGQQALRAIRSACQRYL